MEDVETAYYRGDYSDFIVVTEKIRVPAGTYTAEHVVIVDSYTIEEENGESETYEMRYEWWIDKNVPGDLVKYEWTSEAQETVLRGELLKHQQGYSTQLSSF